METCLNFRVILKGMITFSIPIKEDQVFLMDTDMIDWFIDWLVDWLINCLIKLSIDCRYWECMEKHTREFCTMVTDGDGEESCQSTMDCQWSGGGSTYGQSFCTCDCICTSQNWRCDHENP